MKAIRKVSKVDDFFELDRYQLIVLLFNEFLIYTMLSNVVFNIFGTAPPQLLGCDGILYNGTKAEKCLQYDADFNCKEPMMSYEFQSTAVEFLQVCSRHELTWMDSVLGSMGITNKVKFSTTSQMIGIMIGSAISGHFSDLYGRKKITLAFLVLMFASSLGSSMVPSIDIYIIVRHVIGIACGGLTTVGTIFIVEMLPAGHRLWLCTVITWAPNYILFALFAFLTGSWRRLAMASNVVTLLAILICAILMPESPKYLVQKKRKTQAIQALEYVNKFKKDEHKISSECIVSVVEAACEQNGDVTKAEKYSYLDLYSTKSLAIRTIVISIGMFSLSYVTYGLIFNLDVIKGSIYLNTAFSGMLRWVVGATVAVVDHFGRGFVGRKRMHFVTMSIIMTAMAGTFLIKISGYDAELSTVVRVFTLLAFGTTGTVFLQFLLVTSELFPTGIRNLANANINVCGRLGNVFGPMVFSLAAPITGFPYLIMAIFCLTDVLLFQFFIPETKGNALPSEMPQRKLKISKSTDTEEKLLSKA